MKLLIVEDEVALAKVLEEKFKKEKYEVRMAEDGVKAMEAVAKFVPEIILLDLLLPKKGGLEVLEELKNSEEWQNIPVIVLSNLDDDQNIKKALKLGAVDYFVKAQHPIKEVVEKVGAYIIQPNIK